MSHVPEAYLSMLSFCVFLMTQENQWIHFMRENLVWSSNQFPADRFNPLTVGDDIVSKTKTWKNLKKSSKPCNILPWSEWQSTVKGLSDIHEEKPVQFSGMVQICHGDYPSHIVLWLYNFSRVSMHASNYECQHSSQVLDSHWWSDFVTFKLSVNLTHSSIGKLFFCSNRSHQGRAYKIGTKTLRVIISLCTVTHLYV